MRSFINIFLTLIMPMSILFTASATVYYSTSFIFSKAIRLGTITGVLGGITLAFVIAFILAIVRTIRVKGEKISTSIDIVPNPTIYEKKSKSVEINSTNTVKEHKSQISEKRFTLLMNKELVYEVSLNTINQNNFASIINENKDDGSILLHIDKEQISIKINSLTRHTSEVFIYGNQNNSYIQTIISTLKEKEHSFIQF